MFDAMDTPRSLRVLLQGWEEFDEPVDRIVSIGALEHFGHERYPAFFRMAYEALPADGVMLLHSICGRHPKDAEKLIPLTFELARFVKFIMTEIFPGGRLPSVPMVEERAAEAGFRVGEPGAITATPLCEDAGPVGRGAAGAPGASRRDPVPRGLRPLYEVPDRVCGVVPAGAGRRQSVHAEEVAFGEYLWHAGLAMMRLG
jgi:hypothetical protein